MTEIIEVGTDGGDRVHGEVPDRPSGSRSRQSLGRNAHSGGAQRGRRAPRRIGLIQLLLTTTKGSKVRRDRPLIVVSRSVLTRL